ncbi:MAG TPA: hypothetical protein VKY56_01970 [Chloroflexota bacterium]|nr:hypothetical protein [Chloroflexota bacterium]
MEERYYQGSGEDDLPEVTGRRFRRGRRHTPPGELPPRLRCRQRRHVWDRHPVQIGDVIADLTPRQAVVWLLNLDTMVALYESTTGRILDEPARAQLVHALRSLILEHR